MNYSIVKTFATLSCAFVFAAAAYGQGLYWQSKTTGTVGERTAETWAVPKKMKMVQTGTDQTITIMRLDKEVIWQLNPAKKTYSEMTFAQLEHVARKAGGKMDAAMAQMQEQMKNMSEDERKMMEKMMGGRMPGAAGAGAAPAQVTNTGERKTISGFATTKYTVRQGDQTAMTLWVTKDIRGFDELREDWQAFSRRMAAMLPQGRGMADAYKNIDGFPIQTEMSGIVTTVTKVERRSAPANEFEIPSGYTKVRGEMEEAMEKMDSDGE